MLSKLNVGALGGFPKDGTDHVKLLRPGFTGFGFTLRPENPFARVSTCLVLDNPQNLSRIIAFDLILHGTSYKFGFSLYSFSL